VLATVKDASRRQAGGLTALLDRRCARRPVGTWPGWRNGLLQPNRETPLVGRAACAGRPTRLATALAPERGAGSVGPPFHAGHQELRHRRWTDLAEAQAVTSPRHGTRSDARPVPAGRRRAPGHIAPAGAAYRHLRTALSGVPRNAPTARASLSATPCSPVPPARGTTPEQDVPRLRPTDKRRPREECDNLL